jgi:hypothetical protein
VTLGDEKYRVGHLHLHEEVRRIEGLPIVMDAYRRFGRRPVRLFVRRGRKTYGTGHAWSDCRIVLTLPRGDACLAEAAVLIAHEVAHVATPDAARHGEEWRQMFLAILRDGYGLDVPWPTAETGRRASYHDAHVAFVKMLEGEERATG